MCNRGAVYAASDTPPQNKPFSCNGLSVITRIGLRAVLLGAISRAFAHTAMSRWGRFRSYFAVVGDEMTVDYVSGDQRVQVA